MKHQHAVLPKKFLPRGSRRITLPDGTRAWLIGGMTFPSKRAYFEWREAQRNISAVTDKNNDSDQTQVNPPLNDPTESEAENV